MVNISNINNPYIISSKSTQLVSTQPNKGKVETNCVENKNLIDNYITTQGLYNQPLLKSTKFESNPSGISNYNNYFEKDINGNVLTSVVYSQENGSIIQKVKTTSADGTTVDRTTSNNDSVKQMTILIKDKNGKVLLNKNKSTEKISDDVKKTTVNGEVYNVSGLNSDILSVEHNGEIVNIDLRKMTDEEVGKMSLEFGKNGEEIESFEERKNPITDDERKILYSKVKHLDGDDLFRLSKQIQKLSYLDVPDGALESFYNGENRKLIYSKDVGGLVLSHELGHGVNHNVNTNVGDFNALKSNNEHYQNMYNYEVNNFHKNPTVSSCEKLFDLKFTNVENMMRTGMTREEAEQRVRDENFAESYVVLNCTDILNFDENIHSRALALTKNMPRTLAQVEYLSNQ